VQQWTRESIIVNIVERGSECWLKLEVRLFNITEKTEKSFLTSFCMVAMYLSALLMDGMLLASTFPPLIQ